MKLNFCKIIFGIAWKLAKIKITSYHMTMHVICINKNTWGVKKVRGQEEPATKSFDIKLGQEKGGQG